MTTIPTIATTSNPEKQRASGAAKADLDYSAFLRLFVASMKNQDPIKPNDPSQTLSQLASFSNVEQSIKVNDKLESLLALSEASSSATLLGQRMSSLDGSVSGNVAEVERAAGGMVAVLSTGERLHLSLGYKLLV